MEEEMVSVGIWSEGLHFSLRLPKELADKMGEIGSQNPEMWEDRGFDLMKEARKALEAESRQQSQPQPESQENNLEQ